MYCRKCGKQISDDAKYCTLCGAPTCASEKKPKKNIAVRVLLGIGAWFGGMALVGFMGIALDLGTDGHGTPLLYRLAVLFVPAILAAAAAMPDKTGLEKRPNPEQQTATAMSTPVKPTPIPVASTATAGSEKPAAADDPPRIVAISIRRTYRVAGVSFHTREIEELAYENEDYDLTKREMIDHGLIDQNVWKYKFYPSTVELEPEPGTPEDPRAIKVLVDGLHVGCIKSSSLGHLHKLMREERIVRIGCQIGGGPYKRVTEDFDDGPCGSTYTLERSEVNYSVQLEIEESVR